MAHAWCWTGSRLRIRGLDPSGGRPLHRVGTVGYEDEPVNIPISGTFTSISEVDDAIDKFLSQRWAISVFI